MESLKNILAWITLCVIWGTIWLVIKIGLADVPPMTFVTVRFSVATVILLPLVFARRLPLPSSRSEWLLVLGCGTLQFTVCSGLSFWAAQFISSGLSTLIQALIPLFGLVIGWFIIPFERVSILKSLAVVIGVFGVATIFFDQLSINSRMASIGCVVATLGSMAAAKAVVHIKAKGKSINPISLIGFQMLASVPLNFVFGYVREGNPLAIGWTWKSVVCVMAVGSIGTVLPYGIYYWLIKRIELSRVTSVLLVSPLLAVIAGAIVLDEQFPPRTLLGGVLIVASSAAIVLGRNTRQIEQKLHITG